MSATMKPITDVTQEAVAILRRELGVVDTLRFLRQFRAGAGNYTNDREDIFAEEIFAEARRIRSLGYVSPTCGDHADQG